MDNHADQQFYEVRDCAKLMATSADASYLVCLGVSALIGFSTFFTSRQSKMQKVAKNTVHQISRITRIFLCIFVKFA